MELDPITKMMVVAKQQILLYQATHNGQRLSVDAEKLTDETPDVTRFCLDTAYIVRSKVAELDPDDKFALLNMLDNFLHKIRLDIADEWTYCAHCHTYVKRSNCKIIDNGDGTYNVACGNCGGYHFINKKS